MPLNKIQYTDDVTVIPASNLNDIQDEVIANGTSSTSAKTEVEDIRTGVDGTVYATAGDAVRNQIKSISEVTKNLFNGVISYFKNMALNDGKVSNTVADGRTSFCYIVRFRTDDTIITASSANVISTTGRHSITVNYPFTIVQLWSVNFGNFQNTSSTANVGIFDLASWNTTSMTIRAFRNSANADGWNVEPAVMIHAVGLWK